MLSSDEIKNIIINDLSNQSGVFKYEYKLGKKTSWLPDFEKDFPTLGDFINWSRDKKLPRKKNKTDNGIIYRLFESQAFINICILTIEYKNTLEIYYINVKWVNKELTNIDLSKSLFSSEYGV